MADNSTGLADLMHRASETAQLAQGRAAAGMASGFQPRSSLAKMKRELEAMRAKQAGPVDQQRQGQAQLLHANVDVRQIVDGAKSITIATSLEAPVVPQSVDDFIRNERQNAIVAANSKAQKNVQDLFHDRHFKYLTQEWEQEKNEIRRILGAGELFEEPASRHIGQDRHVGAMAHSTLTAAQTEYARVIERFVDAVALKKQHFPIISEFKALATSAEKSPEIKEMWDIVGSMLQGPDRSQIKPGYYRQDEFKQPEQRRHALPQTMAKNARKLMENRYAQYILRSTPPETSDPLAVFAERSMNDVLRTSGIAQHSQQSNELSWAKVYYAMRSGNLRKALEYARDLPQEVSKFVSQALDQDSSDPPRAWERLSEYYRQAKNQQLLYQRIVCHLLTRHDADRDIHQEVACTIEDFIYVKLCLLQDSPQDKPHPLFELQHLLSEVHGESHFEADRAPWKYLRMLLMTAQFEKAVQFVFKLNVALGVHLAIALNYYGVIGVTDTMQNGQLERTDPRSRQFDGSVYQLNLGLIVKQYVQPFATTNPAQALNYYYVLSMIQNVPPTLEEGNPFKKCVADLAVQSGQWKLLLGRRDWDSEDASPIGGLVNRLVSDDGARLQIIHEIAEQMRKDGRIYDAIRLFDLADAREKVIEVINDKLSEDAAMDTATSDESASEFGRVLQFARQIETHTRYGDRVIGGHVPNPSSPRETLTALLKMIEFFQLYQREQWQDAYEKLKGLSQLYILPQTPQEVEACVDFFDSLPEQITKNMSQLILCAMSCLQQLSMQLGASSSFLQQTFDGGERQKRMEYRQRAEALLDFQVKIPQHMPGEASSQLTQMATRIRNM